MHVATETVILVPGPLNYIGFVIKIYVPHFSYNYLSFICSGNPKEEPGAIVCRVAPSFLRFGSYQIHASREKEDLAIVRTLADYAIRHHFPHIENMSRSESLSFNTGNEEHSVVDLTSNKYAGNHLILHKDACLFCCLV